jgi:hypothetical protein
MSWGLAPRQVANQLERCFRAEADIMRVLGAWTARVSENDERLAFARDLGYRAEHGEWLLARLRRLRTTERMIRIPDEAWRRTIELIDAAPDTPSLVAAVYRVVGAQLLGAYGALLKDCDPLADEPTIRMISQIQPDHEDRRGWALRFLAGRGIDQEWLQTVERTLAEAGGLMTRDETVPDDRADPEAANGTGFWPLPRSAPGTMELGSEYRLVSEGEQASYCPPFDKFSEHDAEVLANHHGLMPELSSLAIVGNLLHEIHDSPWDFYRDFATQCSDEVRHIGLLLRQLDELGSGPDAHPFPHWTFYDAVGYLPAKERTLVFNAIVEGNVVESLHDRARALRQAGCDDSAYVCDWISADESLHLLNGIRWLDVTDVDDVDRLLDRGHAILGEVMRQKGTSEKAFDSASESLSKGDFYAKRANPVAPIVRELGGFTPDQIARLIDSADGRIIRA